MLAELAGRPERWATPLTVVAGALVLSSASFAVAEYDTDVPQFDEVFYLPVLGFAAGIALVLVRTAADSRWAATCAALAHAGFSVLVGGFLTLVDFPPPALPLLAVPALVVDVAQRRRWQPALASALYTAALHGAYVPVRNVLGDGVRFDTADVLAGAAMTWIGAYLIFRVAYEPAVGQRLRSRSVSATAGAAALLLLLAVAAPALAHDPGQGRPAGTVALRVDVDDADQARLTAELPDDLCGRTEPRALVARRAGEIARATLTKDGCVLRGALDLPDRGRWFVYAEMRREGRRVESWLPVQAGAGRFTISEAERYAYIPPERSGSALKYVGGVLLYAAMLALLYATFRLIRASSRERQARTPSAAAT